MKYVHIYAFSHYPPEQRFAKIALGGVKLCLFILAVLLLLFYRYLWASKWFHHWWAMRHHQPIRQQGTKWVMFCILKQAVQVVPSESSLHCSSVCVGLARFWSSSISYSSGCRIVRSCSLPSSPISFSAVSFFNFDFVGTKSIFTYPHMN